MLNENSLEDKQLINNIKSEIEVDESLQELINRHSGAYIDAVNKYFGSQNRQINKQDLMDEKDTFIWEVSKVYDDEKGAKFPTFIQNMVKYKCLSGYTKAKKDPVQTYDHSESHYIFDSVESGINIFENSLEKKESFDIINKLVDDIDDERAKQIIRLRYSDDRKERTWHSIGEKVGVSYERCRQIHKEMLPKLKKKMKEHNEY